MPYEKLAEISIGALAVGGLIYLGVLFITNWFKQKDNPLSEVVQNNTKAMEKLTDFIQDVRLEVAKQGEKIDELVARARQS